MVQYVFKRLPVVGEAVDPADLEVLSPGIEGEKLVKLEVAAEQEVSLDAGVGKWVSLASSLVGSSVLRLLFYIYNIEAELKTTKLGYPGWLQLALHTGDHPAGETTATWPSGQADCIDTNDISVNSLTYDWDQLSDHDAALAGAGSSVYAVLWLGHTGSPEAFSVFSRNAKAHLIVLSKIE